MRILRLPSDAAAQLRKYIPQLKAEGDADVIRELFSKLSEVTMMSINADCAAAACELVPLASLEKDPVDGFLDLLEALLLLMRLLEKKHRARKRRSKKAAMKIRSSSARLRAMTR